MDQYTTLQNQTNQSRKELKTKETEEKLKLISTLPQNPNTEIICTEDRPTLYFSIKEIQKALANIERINTSTQNEIEEIQKQLDIAFNQK